MSHLQGSAHCLAFLLVHSIVYIHTHNDRGFYPIKAQGANRSESAQGFSEISAANKINSFATILTIE